MTMNFSKFPSVRDGRFAWNGLRDAAHADVLAWNMQFGKLPSAPF